MKLTFLSAIIGSLAVCSVSSSFGQTAAASLGEDFNSNCPTGWHHPVGWMDYNPILSTMPEGQWLCAADGGRGGTRGIKCTNLWGSPAEYHLDTAFLISPKLDLSSYLGGPIYLQFDTKTSKINLGAKLSVVASYDSNFHTYIGNLDQLMTPVFGPDDSTDWTTHQFDLSGFTTAADFYIAFRYVGAPTSGSVWYLDNIRTSRFALNVSGSPMPTRELSMFASGNTATGEVKIALSAANADDCDLAIYDLMGRVVHRQQLRVYAGENTYTVRNVYTAAGVYIVKVGNSATMGTAKFVMQ